MIIFSEPKNESDAEVWNDLKSSLKACPNLKFKDFDCVLHPLLCDELNIEFTPSYLVFAKNELIDIYYGQRTVESMRSYCLTLLGFHVPRSLPAPADVNVADPKHTSPRLNATNFDDEVQVGITLVM